MHQKKSSNLTTSKPVAENKILDLDDRRCHLGKTERHIAFFLDVKSLVCISYHASMILYAVITGKKGEQ